MKTIYLDHNIARYFVRGFPNATDKDDECAARKECVGRSPRIRFALSFWNMFEAACHSDTAELANAYADLWMELHPLYLPLHSQIAREELSRCVFAELGLADHLAPVRVFYENLSEVLAASRVDGILVGITLRDMILHLARNKKLQKTIRSQEQVIPPAMATLQEARQDGRARDPNLVREMHRAWLRGLMPERKPDGAPIAPKERREVLEALATDPERVYRRCPTLRAESVLTDVRARFACRDPERQDAIDLMHAVPALAYCDALVTNDGHLRQCAQQTAKQLGRRLVVARRLSEVLGSFE